MEDRTRILITHHVGLCISEASYLIHLENGRINLCGSPDELEATGTLETILDDVIGLADEERRKETIEEEVEEIDPNPTIVGPTADLLKKAATNKATAPKVLIKEESM
jgi:ABC-type multidrug transport system ATPase subunit